MNGNDALNACVLVPGDVHLSTTGADVGRWVVLAGALVAVGVVLLLVTMIVRRKRQGHGVRVLAAALVLLAVVGLAQVPASRASAAVGSGCDLIGWSMLSAMGVGQNTALSEDPSQVVSFSMQNVTTFPIDVQFRTDTTGDPDSIAPFVELAANCTGCAVPVVYLDRMGAGSPGAAFRLAPGQRADFVFTARTTPDITNDKQGKSATFSIVALSRQV